MDDHSSLDHFEQLEKLKELNEKGLLSNEEYSAEKERVLKQLSENPEKNQNGLCLVFGFCSVNRRNSAKNYS